MAEKFKPGFGTALPPDPGTKSEGDTNVKAIEQQALLGFNLVLILVQNAEVKD